MKKSGDSSGIRQIAEHLNVSIATVDRALHGRPMRELTRARVLAAVEKLNYKPNASAQALKLKRRLRIGVQLPAQLAVFFEALAKGIQEQADATIGVDVEVIFFRHERLGTGDREVVQQMASERLDGAILVPFSGMAMKGPIRVLTDQGTAVFCVASDAPKSSRIAAVSIDAFLSGSLVGELFSLTLQGSGSIAAITGDVETTDHAEKIRGLAANLAVLAPHLRLLPLIEAHDDYDEAYRQVTRLIEVTNDLSGIYVSTANSLPVLRAVAEHAGRKLRIITTDLFPEIQDSIESSIVTVTLFQRPATQGRMVFDLLLRHLLNRRESVKSVSLTPHLVFRSNLALFQDPYTNGG